MPTTSASLRRADVGRVDEHLRHRQHAALAVEIVDGLVADRDRTRGVEAAFQRHLAGIQRHRRGEALEGRAHLVEAGRHAVQPVLVLRIERIVRVEIRHRRHRHHLAGLDVEHDGAGRDGVVALHRRRRSRRARCAGRCRSIESLTGLQILGHRQAGRLQVGKALLVDVFLHAGDALVVDVGQADDVRRGRAARIEAPLLGAEADAGNAELS